MALVSLLALAHLYAAKAAGTGTAYGGPTVCQHMLGAQKCLRAGLVTDRKWSLGGVRTLS